MFICKHAYACMCTWMLSVCVSVCTSLCMYEWKCMLYVCVHVYAHIYVHFYVYEYYQLLATRCSRAALLAHAKKLCHKIATNSYISQTLIKQPGKQLVSNNTQYAPKLGLSQNVRPLLSCQFSLATSHCLICLVESSWFSPDFFARWKTPS